MSIMQVSQYCVTTVIVVLVSISPGLTKVVFEKSDQVKLQDDNKFQPMQRTQQKPVKFDTVAASNPALSIVAHPYSYEDSSLDTYPYAATATPAYTPPILKESDNSYGSKLGFFEGSDHHGVHHNSHQHPPWGKLVRLFIAAIPIGLFLAALPPNVVNINATQPVKTVGLVNKQRSEVDGPASAMQTFPVLDMIERMGGLPALEHPGCEARIFCQMSRLGSQKEANSVQRFLWTTAHETPDALAELLGVREILKAVRTDACSIYNCPIAKQPESTKASNYSQ